MTLRVRGNRNFQSQGSSAARCLLPQLYSQWDPLKHLLGRSESPYLVTKSKRFIISVKRAFQIVSLLRSNIKLQLRSCLASVTYPHANLAPTPRQRSAPFESSRLSAFTSSRNNHSNGHLTELSHTSYHPSDPAHISLASSSTILITAAVASRTELPPQCRAQLHASRTARLRPSRSLPSNFCEKLKNVKRHLLLLRRKRSKTMKSSKSIAAVAVPISRIVFVVHEPTCRLGSSMQPGSESGRDGSVQVRLRTSTRCGSASLANMAAVYRAGAEDENVQHARNLYDRAVSILPRIDQLWYKYVHLEELLGNVSGTRQVFERWMAWEPEEKAWHAYINLEVRYSELDRASSIWERAVTCHPTPKQWIRWAKFEEDRGDLEKARMVFQMALDYIGEDEDAMEKAQSVFTAFAKMETRLKEYERARVIYKYALERLPRSKSEGIYSSYTRFEKQFGTMSSVEDTVIGKRRIQYEEELSAAEGSSSSTTDHDTWFDYSRLEEDAYRALSASGGSQDSSRKQPNAYVKSTSVPSLKSPLPKRNAIGDVISSSGSAMLSLKRSRLATTTEHGRFTKLPLPSYHTSFHICQTLGSICAVRSKTPRPSCSEKIMGTAIGMAPKLKLFSAYIELELSLKEFDRARKIYEKRWNGILPTRRRGSASPSSKRTCSTPNAQEHCSNWVLDRPKESKRV